MKLLKAFKTTQSDLLHHNGKAFTILRPLTSDEADLHDIGPMYKIRLVCGEIIEAYEDEIRDYQPGEVPFSVGI